MCSISNLVLYPFDIHFQLAKVICFELSLQFSQNDHSCAS